MPRHPFSSIFIRHTTTYEHQTSTRITHYTSQPGFASAIVVTSDGKLLIYPVHFNKPTLCELSVKTMSQNSSETAEENHHFQELLLAPPWRKLSRPSPPSAPTSKCRSCLESFTMYELRALSTCGHCYCKDCVHWLVDNSLKGMVHFPARCCGMPIKLGPDVADFLPAETIERYETRMLEFCQRNKRYCARASCSAFLRNSDIQGEIGTCRVCKERTCIQCKHKAHEGECKTDDDETQLLEFAKKARWQ